jgi:hypothetical protein
LKRRRRLKVKVTSHDAAEEADYYVCVPAEFESPYSDNLTGACAECGRPIQFRPHAPVKPKKVCMECGMERSMAAGTVHATESTAREVAAYLFGQRRKGMN